MRGLTILGVVLIVIGVGAALLGHFSFTETKPLIDAGPIRVNSQEDHTVWIPTLAAIATIAAGATLIVVGQRRT